MKTYCKIVGLLSILFMSHLSVAQQRNTPGKRAKHQADWMYKHLGINDDQYSKVYDIILKSASENEDVKGMRRSRIKQNAKVKIAHERDHDLKMVLSADQFADFKNHVADMKQKRERRNNTNGYNRY